MRNEHGIKSFLSQYWLLLLIIAQPLLDILAYWTRSPEGTAAGYFRLAVMLLLPLYLLLTLKEKKKFILSMLVIGLLGLLHVLNCLRVGYLSPAFDLSYLAKTMQMPILAICFGYYIRDEQTKNQAYRGLLAAAFISAAALALACLTGTGNCTYGVGLGVSGWVIDDNRCANSAILVTLACFAVYFSSRSANKLVNLLVPLAVSAVLIANGTKACYYGLFAIFLGYAAFLLLHRLITGRRLKTLVVVSLLLLAVGAAAVYPYTPRYKVSASQAQAAAENQNEIEQLLAEKGYDLTGMTPEEKLADPVVRQVFADYYRKIMWCVIPDLFDRFPVDELLLKYNMTTDAATLIDVRQMKTTYAALMWDHCDPLTRLVGFEVSDIWFNGGCDLENDWPAIYYYYGYLGIASYVGLMLYYVFLILRRLFRDFKGSLTLENFVLLLSFALSVGLAQFSGSVLRRPNVSVYLALVLALIHYQTVVRPRPVQPDKALEESP